MSFEGNRAVAGGAIATTSDGDRLSINASTLQRNSAVNRGGALIAEGGVLRISNSAFLENTADGSGGAIEAARGGVTILNSTFDNNEAAQGGAVSISGADTTLTHLTMSLNLAFFEGDAVSKDAGTLRLRNSIIVGRGSGADCQGELDQNIGNFIADGSCSPALRGAAFLGELFGRPAYRLLAEDSPAINAAAPEFCPATDQVGTARPNGAGCDIGAIESTALQEETGPAPPPACVLSDQIVAANRDQPSGGCPAGRGHDIIIFTKDITLEAVLPPITSSITIEGAGFSISGANTFRLFDIDGGDVTINNLTLMRGNSPHEKGGAIKLENGGRLNLSNMEFRNNAAGWGGAIATSGQNARLKVNSSSFHGNAANSHGGSSLTQNRNAIIIHAGGAIYVDGGLVEIVNSSFRNNRADFSGGAVEIFRGALSISNSSFRRNTARDSSGGGIYVGGGTATLTHLTLMENYAYRGGGINQSGGRVRLRNSIIAGSRGGDCVGWFNQNSGNLIEDGSCRPELREDPMLQGPVGVPFHLQPQDGSPVIHAADAAFCTESDQIGRARPQAGACDIGAIQSVPIESPLSACDVTTSYPLNFRDAPGGNRIGSVPIDTTLAAATRTVGWFRIVYDGTPGWISADYVMTAGECS